jgi:hypothetical protein
MEEKATVTEPPRRLEVPEPTGDPFADWLEYQIIRTTAMSKDDGRLDLLHYVTGLAAARTKYLVDQGREPYKAIDYVSLVAAVVKHLSPRQRWRLINPIHTRAGQQEIVG